MCLSVCVTVCRPFLNLFFSCVHESDYMHTCVSGPLCVICVVCVFTCVYDCPFSVECMCMRVCMHASLCAPITWGRGTLQLLATHPM